MRTILIAAALVCLAAPATAQGLRGADANGDGAVTRAEALALREAMFDRVDANGDGYLTEAEQAAMREGRAGRRGGAGAERMEAARAEMDADGDGRLSQAEFMNGPMPLFDRADANSDGVLSAAELRAARSQMQALRARRQ
ncbi:MAG: hypothetical protein GC206_11465 [Alphaproteobacteria bacterium]|nr:hypothetical protein [Alphaproteobacteria bacterium]